MPRAQDLFKDRIFGCQPAGNLSQLLGFSTISSCRIRKLRSTSGPDSFQTYVSLCCHSGALFHLTHVTQNLETELSNANGTGGLLAHSFLRSLFHFRAIKDDAASAVLVQYYIPDYPPRVSSRRNRIRGYLSHAYFQIPKSKELTVGIVHPFLHFFLTHPPYLSFALHLEEASAADGSAAVGPVHAAGARGLLAVAAGDGALELEEGARDLVADAGVAPLLLHAVREEAVAARGGGGGVVCVVSHV